MNIKTLKFQVIFALSIQLLLISIITGFILHSLNARKHDYIILNLSGQLRVISEVLLKQSENYLIRPARDHDAYDRDLKHYNKDLKNLIEDYDAIITSFIQRNIATDAIGSQEDIVCNWDTPSRNQLQVTSDIWHAFKSDIDTALGKNEELPKLEAAAWYIHQNGQRLILSTKALSSAFRDMMETKLANIKYLQQLAISLSLLLALSLIWILYRKVFKPIDLTVKGFKRVSQGDLYHQVPVITENEVGQLTQGFNQLTIRLASIFRLTDRINQANNLDETLRFVFEEFRHLLPIDWVGILYLNPQSDAFILERSFGENRTTTLIEGGNYATDNEILSELLEGETVLLSLQEKALHNAKLADALSISAYRSAIIIPLSSLNQQHFVLVFASNEVQAYTYEHREFLSNIAKQVSNSLDKTLGMEALVISTLEGLAKLAESRDPETGDHLLRMSQYSSILAQELSKTDKYASEIDRRYIRDILRFSPMHDIGKVGIEDGILLKPGKLDSVERKEMELHPVIGGEVLRRCESQMNAVGRTIFQIGIEIAEAHHEKFDGSGYPHGLEGEQIPLSARIVSVADVFDALTSRRPYKAAWSVDDAMDFLQKESGKHFDPDVITALESALPQIMTIYQQYKHV